MTEQERQEHMDAVRAFLEHNGGKPWMLVAFAVSGDSAGCITRRLGGVGQDANAYLAVISGILYGALGTKLPVDTRSKTLLAAVANVYANLSAEAGNEAD